MTPQPPPAAGVPRTAAGRALLPTAREVLDGITSLLESATDAPWEWLDGDGEVPDELQDGHGEMVATGFRDDVVLDGVRLTTDGRLCAALRNAAPDLIAAARAAIEAAAQPALDVERQDQLVADLTWALSRHENALLFGTLESPHEIAETLVADIARARLAVQEQPK